MPFLLSQQDCTDRWIFPKSGRPSDIYQKRQAFGYYPSRTQKPYAFHLVFPQTETMEADGNQKLLWADVKREEVLDLSTCFYYLIFLTRTHRITN